MNLRSLPLLAILFSAAAAAQESPLLACRKLSVAAERLACYDAISPAAVPANAEAAGPPKLIETSIAGTFRGWSPKDRIAMTNGQVWQIVDGTSAVVNLTDPKVVIRRGFFGGYRLDIDGMAASPSVSQVLSAAEVATETATAAEQSAKAAADSVVETSIAGKFTGWWPKEKIRMANGQVWQISDDSTGAVDLTDPKVRIRREFIGGYRLEIEGSAKAPAVKRVQ